LLQGFMVAGEAIGCQLSAFSSQHS
jgi:hypothetical protein